MRLAQAGAAAPILPGRAAAAVWSAGVPVDGAPVLVEGPPVVGAGGDGGEGVLRNDAFRLHRQLRQRGQPQGPFARWCRIGPRGGLRLKRAALPPCPRRQRRERAGSGSRGGGGGKRSPAPRAGIGSAIGIASPCPRRGAPDAPWRPGAPLSPAGSPEQAGCRPGPRGCADAGRYDLGAGQKRRPHVGIAGVPDLEASAAKARRPPRDRPPDRSMPMPVAFGLTPAAGCRCGRCRRHRGSMRLAR